MTFLTKCHRMIFRVFCWPFVPNVAGQILTTSAEVTLNCGLVMESPQNPLNSGLGIILICPENVEENFPKFDGVHTTMRNEPKLA